MKELLLSSKEIIERAITDYTPYAIVLMLSGGDDSMTALEVCKALNVPLTHIMHGITGTGIQETTDFVRKVCEKEKAKYIEADAGDSYVNYVMRKGFFGVGDDAHAFSYNVLKQNHFKSTVSKYIRKGVKGRRVLFVNGARRLESVRRMKTMKNPIKVNRHHPNNIWVNIVNEWDKPDCMEFLEGNGVERNPVAIKLCRSGECFCGTMQSKMDRIEASLLYPKWGKWIDKLDKIVKEKHGFGWGEKFPEWINPNQTKLDFFQPMCVGCEKHYEDNQHLFVGNK